MRKLKRKLLAISAGIILSSGLALVSINNTNNNDEIMCARAVQPVDAATWLEENFFTMLEQYCTDQNADNSEMVSTVWQGGLIPMWSLCSDEGKEYLKNYQVGDEGGNARFDQFASLYDHIIQRYGLEDFIGRNVASAKSANTTILKNNQTETYVVSAITLVCLTSLGAFYFVKKNKKEHN